MVSNPLLISSYYQYKLDTDNVAEWLAHTARRCGYASDLLKAKFSQGTSLANGGNRLKGKARKLAKDASTAKSSAKTYTIAIKEFIDLAEFIASHSKNAQVKIPETFAASLRRAIDIRRAYGAEVSQALREQKRKENKASDERHNYFIGVLEHVRDVLRPYMPQRFQSDATEASKSESLANQSEKLKVYEPSKEFLNAPDVTIHLEETDGEPPSDHYEADRTNDFKEAILMFHLLLSDMAKMRAVVEQTWDGYKKHIFDLPTAALTTNTAVDLARRMVEDAEPIFEPHGGCEGLMHKLYMAYSLQFNQDPEHVEQPGDYFNLRLYDCAEAMFWPTYRLLEGFCAIAFGDDNMLQFKPDHFGVYNPRANRDLMDNRAKANEDRVLLMSALGEISLLCKITEPMTWEDGMTSGLRETLCKTNRIPLWLTFAVQLHMDVHHVLRSDVNRAYDDLRGAANSMRSSMQSTLDLHSKCRSYNWPRSNDRAFDVLFERIDFVTKDDPIYAKKKTLDMPGGIGKPYDWLKQHPVFAGLYLFHLKSMYQRLGIGFVNAWGSIRYMGHLYNALRHEKMLQKQWTDMEILFTFHKDFFVGKQPTTADEYMTRHALSMGSTASAFAKNKRANNTGRIEQSSRGPRVLQFLAPVSSMFYDRYCEAGARTDLNKADLETILSEGMWDVNDDESKGMNAAAARRGDFGSDFKVFARSEASAASTKKRLRKARYTYSDYLLALRNCVMAESFEFSFNYLTLHKVCWHIYRTMDQRLQPQLIKFFGPQYIEKESQLPYIIGYIFRLLVNAERFKDMSPGLRGPGIVKSRMMVEACEVLERTLSIGRIGEIVQNEVGIPFVPAEDVM
ncbi:hypothetical protein KEM56_001807 [Ascosphaera pollenicola]|nr:hypothetical protein KEM56_001807 [Ascosphaera pollenicola]